MADLLPCPFCGNKPELKNFLNPNYYYFVRCTVCNAGTEGTIYAVPFGEDKRENRKIAVDFWNTRAQTLEDCTPVQKLRNERGAGRKPTNWNVKNMLAERRNGWTYRKIANARGLSVGTVHKLINEHMKTG